MIPPPSSPGADAIRKLLTALRGTAPFAPSVDEAVEVTRIGDVACWEAPTLRDTSAVARRLGRAGRCALVFGADAAAARIAVATSLLPVRVTVTSGDLTTSVPLRRLAAALEGCRGSALECLVACAAALDVDSAGRHTFALLRDLIDKAVALLPGSVGRDDRHGWALLQVTRLLFLRFVESEGWLDGRSRFLHEELDRCLLARRDPTRHLLHPLFFGTLNRPVHERSRLARGFGAIPFLNGGLFEPHAIERRHRLSLPRQFWCDAFDSLVERVDVTLDHDADPDVVTPEMLGAVFEGVMRPDERRASGAFFTPPALVDCVVRAAVASHLAATLGRCERGIADALDAPDPELRRALLGINVLDPAVGSGAFLVGALRVLHGPGAPDVARTRHLVARRLHGVDRDPGAVQLCELRLWLEVLRSMRGRRPAEITPLPNLDTTIRAGDMLADPLLSNHVGRAATAVIRERQRAVTNTRDRSHRRALAAMRAAERAALIDALVAREAAFARSIDELLDIAASPTLFGAPARLTAAQRKTLAALRRQRLDLRRERRRIERDTAAGPFAMQTAFAPVIAARGGFDLIVGNPPWVRGQNVPVATRKMLTARYRWWKTTSGSSWAQLPDLSIAFIERAFESLAPGGTFALLAPSKVVTASYGTAARAALTHRATLHCVADLSNDPRAVFDATAYPLALIASRRLPDRDHRVRLGLGDAAPSIPQAEWARSATWSNASPGAQRLWQRMVHRHPPLGSAFRPQVGVKTGLNKAFLDPPPGLDDWCVDAIRGADLSPFVCRRTIRLLWPADARGEPWSSLPAPLRHHLAPFEGRLRARADCRSERWWTIFRTRAATAAHRVAWADLSLRIEAVALGPGAPIPLNSCYVISLGSARAMHALAAWLNSTWIRLFAGITSEPAANGYARHAGRVMASLPLPQEVISSAELSDAGRRAARGDEVQAEVDECCGMLLGLSADDRRELAALAANRR